MNPQMTQFLIYGAVGLLTLINCALFIRRSPSSTPPGSQLLPGPEQRAPIDLNTAMETVLIKAVEQQGAMFERINKLNIENATLAADLLTREGRRRSGKIRAGGARRRRGGQFNRNCRLCSHPMISDPTVAEIVAHSGHRVGADLQVTESNGAVSVHVPEADLDGPGGDRIEDSCPTCGGVHPTNQMHLGENGHGN